MTQPGDYIPVPDIGPTAICLVDAEVCPNGHPLRGNMLRGYLPCLCAGTRGHNTWWCRTCESIVYSPPHDENYVTWPHAERSSST